MEGIISLLREKQNKDNDFNHVAMCFYKTIDNKLTTVGINTTNKRYNNDKITTHAEMSAICNLRYKLSKHRIKKIKIDLIVVRFHKNDELCCSKPCYHCSIELSKNKYIEINNLFYSYDTGKIIKIKFNDWMKNEEKCVSKGWLYKLKMNNINNHK